MSTYWDLVCRKHGESAGFHWNHGERELADIWRAREGLVKLELLEPFLGVGGISFLGPEQSPGAERLGRFARRHYDCDVLPQNEYGEFLDECAEIHDCGACGAQYVCARERGHQGQHHRSYLRGRREAPSLGDRGPNLTRAILLIRARVTDLERDVPDPRSAKGDASMWLRTAIRDLNRARDLLGE